MIRNPLTGELFACLCCDFSKLFALKRHLSLMGCDFKEFPFSVLPVTRFYNPRDKLRINNNTPVKELPHPCYVITSDVEKLVSIIDALEVTNGTCFYALPSARRLTQMKCEHNGDMNLAIHFYNQHKRKVKFPLTYR